MRKDPNITQLWHLRIGHDSFNSDKVDRALLDLTADAEDSELFLGCPAAYPYVEAYYTNEADALAASKAIRRYLSSRKIKINP